MGEVKLGYGFTLFLDYFPGATSIFAVVGPVLLFWDGGVPGLTVFSSNASNPNQATRIRFDESTPEGAETASKWSLLREKLSAPHLADAVSKFWALQWQTLQLQQIAHMNPQWGWLRGFSANVQKFYRKVGQMHSRADAVVRQMQWFGKENLARMQKFTLAEYKGQEHWTELQRKDNMGHFAAESGWI